MTHLMNPTVSETLKVKAVINSFLYEKFSIVLKVDQKICHIHLPDLVQKLEETYDISINKSEVLYVTSHDLADTVQRVLNDRLHLQIIDAIDEIVSIKGIPIQPTTRLIEDLAIGSITMSALRLHIQRTFDVVIPEEKMYNFRVFGSLEHFIRSQIGDRQ